MRLVSLVSVVKLVKVIFPLFSDAAQYPDDMAATRQCKSGETFWIKSLDSALIKNIHLAAHLFQVLPGIEHVLLDGAADCCAVALL